MTLEIRHLDLVQTNIKEFNEKQVEKQKEFIEKFGQTHFDGIMFGSRHHPLKANKSTDYSLSEEELKLLREKKIIFKDIKGCHTFAKCYLDLYNNDMPVFITSDSMLHAFHKYYDNFLMELEVKQFIPKLEMICKGFVEKLQKLNISPKYHDLMADLELFFMIPYLILNLKNELGPNNDSFDNQLTKLTEEQREELLKYTASDELWEKERIQGFMPLSYLDRYEETYKKRLESFTNVNILGSTNVVEQKICKSPKLATIFRSFKLSNINFDINPKYTFLYRLNEVCKLIANRQDISLKMGSVSVTIDGSMFKPRGHYTKSLALQKYFIASTWLSKFQICFKDNMEKSFDKLFLCTALCKIGEEFLLLVNQFESFVEKIIGQSDGYTLSSFLEVINKIIPDSTLGTNLEKTLDWILDNKTRFIQFCQQHLTKKSILTKFGDTEGRETHVSFSILGKGNQIDNIVLQAMIDKNFYDDDGNIPMRKFSSVLDLVYTLFNNNSVSRELQDRMKNIKLEGRDGFKCINHLKVVRELLKEHQFQDTIYSLELQMLRSLIGDMDQSQPFNSDEWLRKQAYTQIAHYAELRHDNVLYLEEVCGMRAECDFPDLMVEPVPNFWRSFLSLIKKMRELNNNKILDNFEKSINMFLTFLDNNSKGIVDKKLEEDLKCIIKEDFMGSGGTSYCGWYMKLFQNEGDLFKLAPEVCSLMTAVDDIRGEGGIVHLGTGPTRMMYILVKDEKLCEKVLLGPTYSCFEFITKSGVRLNDEEWKQSINSHSKLEI